MSPEEMLFLLGLGLVYVIAYAMARNLLVIWPLLTPLGGFFAYVRGGEMTLPMISILGFLDVLGLMGLAAYLAYRWAGHHRMSSAQPLPMTR